MMLDRSHVISAIQDMHNAEEPLCAYIYDLDALKKHVVHIREGLPETFDFFYAIKANSDLPILSTLSELVDGFEASSGGEIKWVRQHFPTIPLIFSGPGKLDSELELAVLNAVTVHVESKFELERLAILARHHNRPVSILLRVNPHLQELKATSLVMGGKSTQFGISSEHLPACLEVLQNNVGFLLFKGFHFHLLSHQLDAEQHLLLLSAYIRQAKLWCEDFGVPAEGLPIEQINVGGGIGVNYRAIDEQFDWTVFAQGLRALLSDQSTGQRPFNPRIRFELGRYITAFCGYYAAEVIDIKTSGAATFAIVRGGTHHFRTPYAQGHSHPFTVLSIDAWSKPYPRPGIRSCKVNIVGQLCTPKDQLATDAPVDELKVGDIVLFSHAGAYAWHISHHDFLRHAHPQHFYLPAH